MGEDIFLIYQLDCNRDIRTLNYRSINDIKEDGLSVKRANYKHIYTGKLESGKKGTEKTMESIMKKFNLKHPADYPGVSLSVSDIVVLSYGKKRNAYYVDSFGFVEVPEFMDVPYKYYSTQRPVDLGTFPKKPRGPILICNFDKREYVENCCFMAWGYLLYIKPLTAKQASDYELRAAPDNPNHSGIAPKQMEKRIQIVGRWEHSEKLQDSKRLTSWDANIGAYAIKEYITCEIISKCFDRITGCMTAFDRKEA